MDRRVIGVVAFSILVSLAASILAYRLTTGRTAAAKRPPLTPVVVATRDILPGDLLKESDLRLAEWPGAPPAQAVRNLEDAKGRGALAAIYRDEPVLQGRLAPAGSGAGLAALIPAGMRAVSVHVSEIAGASGYVWPGMRVDVLGTGTPPGAAGAASGLTTRTILQNIEVLSGGGSEGADIHAKSASALMTSLLVTPDQAELLALATNQGRLQLILRNPLDTEVAVTSGASAGSLYGAPPAPPQRPRPVAAPRFVPMLPMPKPLALPAPAGPAGIELIHGSSRRTVSAEQSAGPGGETSR